MQNDPRYDDVLAEVTAHLARQIEAAVAAGIRRDRIITDPGLGFGKTLQHNVTLMRGLAALHDLGCPVLLGASRKGFIGVLGNAPIASERSPGSVAVALFGVSQGCRFCGFMIPQIPNRR
jgi:dihydropteroate synthase